MGFEKRDPGIMKMDQILATLNQLLTGTDTMHIILAHIIHQITNIHQIAEYFLDSNTIGSYKSICICVTKSTFCVAVRKNFQGFIRATIKPFVFKA